jgi:hypothetical protein
VSVIEVDNVTLTIGGVPVRVEHVSWSPADPLPPRETIGSFEAEGSFEVIGGDWRALIEALTPRRGYWFRRQLFGRRRMWRTASRQLGINYQQARHLFRHGWASLEATKR